MAVKSKAQFRLMKAVEQGMAEMPGLSKKEAGEMTESNKGKKSYKHLPKFAKLKKMMKKGE